MKSIAVTSQSEWKNFESFEREPWAEFKREVVRLGCQIVGLSENPDVVVVFNQKSPPKNASKRIEKRMNNALVVFEPEAVAPSNYSKRNRSQYKRVYVPSPMWKRQDEDRVFDWPQTTLENTQPITASINRKNRFVMILGNHISVGRSELYSLRREVVSIKNMPLDIYGPNWCDSIIRNILRGFKSLLRFILAKNFNVRFPRKILVLRKPLNYLGTVENKFETYAQYKFSLVIENSADYLSEKLIDAVISGTIPIYVGPNLDIFGVPSDLAFQVNGNSTAIREACYKLMESEDLQKKILHSGRDFLSSPRYLEMKNTQALRNLASMIVGDFSGGECKSE